MNGRAAELLESYDLDRLSIAVIASHSALQILHGAKKEDFQTVLVSTPERLGFYREFSHLIDHVIKVDNWRRVCNRHTVAALRQLNAVLVPHGSFVEYVGPSCAEKIGVPLFGLRSIVRVEASQWSKMRLIADAGIPHPRLYRPGDDIEELVIVKLPGAKGGKGYFLARSSEEVMKGLNKLIDEGVLSSESLDEVIVQEYVVGVPAYYHFFYSPVLDRVEILGADIRYESNVDGLRRLPPGIGAVEPSFVVVGNVPLVLRESLLPRIMDYARRFVEATKEKLPPGMIGPFCLESIITDSLEIKVFEFSGRIVAGTNLYVHGSPYSWLYWDEPMSTGRRIAREIRLALERSAIDLVLT